MLTSNLSYFVSRRISNTTHYPKFKESFPSKKHASIFPVPRCIIPSPWRNGFSLLTGDKDLISNIYNETKLGSHASRSTDDRTRRLETFNRVTNAPSNLVFSFLESTFDAHSNCSFIAFLIIKNRKNENYK